MESKIVKQSICLYGHQTSISLERSFLDDLKTIAQERHLTFQQMVEEIDQTRQGNLSSALRVYVLNYWKNGTNGRSK